MYAKIKDIPAGTQVETTFQFTKEMYRDGIFRFSKIQSARPEEWEDWWQVADTWQLQHFVYHISWLEVVG